MGFNGRYLLDWQAFINVINNLEEALLPWFWEPEWAPEIVDLQEDGIWVSYPTLEMLYRLMGYFAQRMDGGVEDRQNIDNYFANFNEDLFPRQFLV